MLLQMFEFPNINPIAIDIGIIKIRWYAISYICGVFLSWFLILKIIKIISKIIKQNKFAKVIPANMMTRNPNL